MNYRSGRPAQDEFKLLCSQAEVTCNSSVEDDHGWDFIVEFAAQGETHQPLDKVPGPRQALVQVNTTVAIPRYDSGAVGNDTIALSIDADGAICSIPTPAPRRATPSALNAKTNAVSPPHSTRHQAPRRFEAQQTAHRRAFFFHHLQVGGPHGTQQRQRPHRQGDVTIPPRPTANLILI